MEKKFITMHLPIQQTDKTAIQNNIELKTNQKYSPIHPQMIATAMKIRVTFLDIVLLFSFQKLSRVDFCARHCRCEFIRWAESFCNYLNFASLSNKSLNVTPPDGWTPCEVKLFHASTTFDRAAHQVLSLTKC